MKHLAPKALLVAACLVGLTTSANAASKTTATFKNQRGSTLTLNFQGQKTGTLTGTFISAVGNCKRDMNKPMPVTGFYNGNAVSVSINFPHCKQVVAMTGNMDKRRNELSTIWLDAHQAKDPAHKDWNTNLIGTDSYQRIG